MMPFASTGKKGETSLSEFLQNFERKLEGEVGAIGSFIGIVRSEAKKGMEVKQLHFECSEDARGQLEKIASNVEDMTGISKVAIHHVVDDLKPGEEILYVLVAGKHRSEVFEALPRVMDQIKSEVHIWKKEITDEKEYWIHEI